ncbi:hypothetical protein K505DRAFT_260177 [Melanomma pulvis-pyrius CBS 109.77]|uniref:C2H2-type domain-containing protein n=1 Tax=Melanomma pulvis-pyrius CBS 109.77 TaxID=1314802 RepID=A0A6A6WQV6_9PLEO|nr:hypothetical protein K505DRAFT_260177 [Melanomma pulvis-pyrius CBS 109.77]
MNPAALPSFASSTTHISAHVDACGRGFISLAAALTNDQRFAAQARPEAINDEFDRFKIWAGNIAAHRKGRRSLEYRLRDAAHLKVETHNLLKALQDSLTNALAIVKGERTPWDELSDSDSDSESDSEPLGDAGEDFQSDTELKQLSASIKNTVTCLFRLSMAIRDPAPNTQSRSFITVDKSYYETHDILHVQSKFPQSDDFLTERLGRAISGRRQYLTYREEHHQKLTKNIEKIGHEEPKTEHTTNSTEASPMPVLDTKVTTVVDDSFDTLSQTSYATSVNATIRAPPLPKEAKEKEHFECPLCYMIVSIHTTAGWKQHVYRDLHPFCCTYEHCTTADRLYDSRRSWFTHELAHRTSWQCIEGCNESFRSEKEFVAHVQASHPDLAADKVISALKHTAEKSANLSEHAKCPLCSKQMTLRALQKHLGHHQEQLSLFALPPNLDETEDDPLDDEVENPVDVAKWQDEELSDISDAADASDDLDVGMENEDLSTTDIGSSSVPWGATPETPLGKLAAIALHFHTEIVPPIEAFIKNPPTDEQTRLSGYSHFSQRILNEVLEVASNVKTDGNYDASLRYNALSTEVNGLLASLSDAMNIVFDPHDRLPL